MTLASLTDCEQLVMKTVWDAEEELSLMEIMQRVNDKYSQHRFFPTQDFHRKEKSYRDRDFHFPKSHRSRKPQFRFS